MIVLIGQMVGCLIVAAGIGVLVGWLLRHLSVRSLNQHIYDVTTALQTKEQGLLAAQLELKAKASALQIYESKIISSEAALKATQEELTAGAERLAAVQGELVAATQRTETVESEHRAALRRFNETDSTIAAFELETRQANAARMAAQQSLSLREEQLLALQDRLKELEGNEAEIHRLKALIADMEPAQGRVHWLEVQLSEKEMQHRVALHDSEEQRAALAQRVSEVEPLQQQVRQQTEALRALQSSHDKALKQLAADAETIEKQRTTLEELQCALGERKIERAAPASETQKDDLKKIPGISPGLERALNEMGTYTFVQIAKWTSADISRVAQRLETAPDRIKRDNWIAAAKKQHRDKYGERL